MANSSGVMTLVTPGEQIHADKGFLRGHGSFVEGGGLRASVAGVVHRVNKLVTVHAVKARYNGDVGDVVIGRVVEIAQKRWLLDVGSRLFSVLPLAAVNLPGGVQRRRNAEDQLQMRAIFKEGDLLSAEVHSIFSDGSIALHTRSLKYCKLEGGSLIKVPWTLVKRMKQHFLPLPPPLAVHVIFGSNGFIWVSPLAEGGGKEGEPAIVPLDISLEQREQIARVRNAIQLLAQEFLMISPDSIVQVVNASNALNIPVSHMLLPELQQKLTECVREESK